MEKQLPNNIEAERSVLGSIILGSDMLEQVIPFLKPEDFYRPAHRLIYAAILQLHERREAADFLTLADELERRNITLFPDKDNATYLSDMVEGVPTSDNAEDYGRIVERTSVHRSLIRISGEIANAAYRQEEDAVQRAEELIFQLGQGKRGNPISNHVEALQRYWDQLEALHEQNSNGVLTGVPTGYKVLNKLLGGFRSSKLYILAARPGDGKTALSLNFAYEAIKRGCQILFFSIEMDEGELMQRLTAIESKVDALHLRDATFEDPDEWGLVIEGMARLQATPGKLWTDDTPANDIVAMRAKARAEQAKHGLDMIIVDYLQLAKAGGTYEHKAENRRLEVERVSRELKEMARELKVPVLALAQLNRDVESRANRMPQLSDLREAGGIEQDCDVAMFIYRDPVIPKEAPEYDISLMIEKHRGGPKGVVNLHFVGAHTRFYPQESQLRIVHEED